MPAEPASINLLAEENLEESPVARIINWSITLGRYIMITTEIIVLLAFVSRFSLDRKLTDLNEAIEQKQVIIEANYQFEADFKNLQKDLANIKSIISAQHKPYQILTTFKTLLPVDAYLESINLTSTSLTGKVIVGTTDSFAMLINNMQAIGIFKEIELGEIKKDPLKGIVFQFNSSINPTF